MNTNKLKAYAPKARVAFMEAVKSRAAKLGIFEDRISEITIDGDSAIIEKEVYTRKQGQQRNQLIKRIEALGTHDGKFVHKDGFNQFINETAFTWFNRLTAIRYMEVNEYLDHGFRVLSKTEGAQFGEGFEILNSAADVADELGLNKDQIIDMVLDGNKEEELYRALLLAQCHQLSEAMPFMFEKLDDATELLLPDNLTKTDSILKDLVNDIPEDNWKDSETGRGQIEVIGWLYQFYISEHKDAVIGKVVKREDIPAATQLFTPNWIVKYLVQNSLGRQWLATYPDSELKEKMEYYITPAEQSDDVIEQLKAITPTSIDPEAIKVLDPACGSGHILVEVYEVLREIYLERGYRLREIPELILTKNIYGLDIDDRAAQMAAFAVMMKAREDDKRIFSRDIKLNIQSIQSSENLNINQLWADLDLDSNQKAGSMGDLFAESQLELAEPSAENKVYLNLLLHLKEQFIDAKNLGSLIEVDSQHLESLAALQEKLSVKAQGSEPTAKEAAQALLPIVEQAIVLATKYDVAVANPPYMGSKGMNAALKDFAKKFYPNSKSDLFAIFMERVFNFL
ncbi:SAM-dependent methyltransferase, partial [Vibrio parahaemolyticus]|uniref:BREX-1 system adenine-specific DNA-methyltransferase PglX n=1 Tax=Vibrio parahaemolyticus TaxID=670 RepID=UPI00111E2B95